MTDDVRDLVALRPARETDVDFIMDVWLKHYRDHAKKVRNTEYYDGHREAIRRLFARDKTQLIVACNRESTDVVLGWLCFDDSTVHYAYVKYDFRRSGVIWMLLQSTPLPHELRYSHTTPQWERWLKRRNRFGRYDPYRFFME